MSLEQKLKICSVVAVVGVILITISFISPGWIISTFENRVRFSDRKNMYSFTQKGHLSIGPLYVSMCLVKIKKGDYSTPNGWYPDTLHEKCSRVPTVYLRESVFPEEFVDWFFQKTLGTNSMFEMQTISSVGIVFALLGSIATIVYTRRMTKYRCTGLLASVTLAISGGTYLAAMLRTLLGYHFCKLDHRCNYIGQYIDTDRRTFYDIYFHFPWSLVLGGIGSLLILIAAVGILFIFIRMKTDGDTHDYLIQVESKDPDYNVVFQSSNTTIGPSDFKKTAGLNSLLDYRKEKEIDSFFDS